MSFIDSIVPEDIASDCKQLRVSLASFSSGVEFHSYRRLLLYNTFCGWSRLELKRKFSLEEHCLSSDFYRNDKHGRQFTGRLDLQ